MWKPLYILREATILIKRWRQHYNTLRPHSSVAGLRNDLASAGRSDLRCVSVSPSGRPRSPELYQQVEHPDGANHSCQHRSNTYRLPKCSQGGSRNTLGICRGDAVEALKGKDRSTDKEAKEATGATIVRQISPGQDVTMDYRQERIVIETDPKTENIFRAYCG